jgi:phospholipid/cholesterol/gamma-HCH transport system substrate-binding protein
MGMTRLSIEAKVGVFVVAGILVLAYMSMKVGKFKYGPGQGYTVQGYFDSAEGLVKGVPVQVAGVDVGRVKDIALEAGKAKITLELNPDVEVGEDVQAAIRTKGVLGDKYVELLLGSPDAALIQPGGMIQRTTSPTNIDSLLQQLHDIGRDMKELTSSFSGVMGGEDGRESLKIIVENLRALSETLNQTVQKNREKIDRGLDNFAVFSQDMREISGNNKDALRKTLDNFQQASGQLNEAILAFSRITEKINRGEGTIGKLIQDEQTAANMNETLVALKEITGKINRGEGTVGKLIQDEETVENINMTLSSVNEYLQKEQRFQTFLDYRGEYLFDSSDVKSYLSLRIQPKEDKYYLLQVVDDPVGKTETTLTTSERQGVVTTETKVETKKDELKFSAQIAKRYYDLGFRAGIFESTGGVAIDYYFLEDHLLLSMEAFDFDSDRDPHMKFRADYTPFKFFYITGGYDDFLSDVDRESFFLGLGLHFSDQDLKTLLAGAPIPK